MITWGTMQLLYKKLDDMTPFTERDKVIFGTMRSILVEHAELKLKYEKLLKKHRKTKKKQDV